MMRRKILNTSLLMIVLLLILSACGANVSQEEAPAEQDIVTVENIEQFIHAIAPDTRIVTNTLSGSTDFN